MDILTFLNILLKPPQPLMGLFFPVLYVTNNTLLWICTSSKGMDFILLGGDSLWL